MSLTDATKLIKRDKNNKAQTRALGVLKKKLEDHKKTLEDHKKVVEKKLRDANRGLAKVNQHLKK